MASDPDRFLLQRGKRWYYQRRVPSQFSHIDERRFAKVSLKTESLEIARLRRDQLAEADDEYWMAMAVEAASPEGTGPTMRAALEHRYKAAIARAMAYGFSYKPAEPLAESRTIAELMARIRTLEANAGKSGDPSRADSEALLGGTPDPAASITVSEAFELYISRIAFDDQYNKSEAQRRSWEKTKRTSITYFIEEIGDLPLSEITRDKALEYRDWWMERMQPQDGDAKPVAPNTANRHIGNMRSLLERYFKHIGITDFEDPFRDFYFSGKTEAKRASFTDDWVRTRILVPGLFDGLRVELRVLIYLLIETGARLSELVNLRAEDIRLNAKVPHIAIRPEQNRELKTEDSRREIPLVGVAEIAMRACPEGFPYYYDKSTLVSANLMKAFRQRNLLPSSDHVIYSFRHSFEDRMLESGLDYGLRCALMGHKNNRPEYGMGGSLEYRRNELMKIAHPFDPGVFAVGGCG
jgi:integrase